jgi:NADPH2:quinone reductase
MTLATHLLRSADLLSRSTTRLSAINSQIAPRAPNIRAMSSLPKTMKAVFIEKTGGTEVLQYKTDVPVPEPKEGEVLVKNEFIGINYIDT